MLQYLQEANFTAGVSVTVKPTSVGRALQALKVIGYPPGI